MQNFNDTFDKFSKNCDEQIKRISNKLQKKLDNFDEKLDNSTNPNIRSQPSKEKNFFENYLEHLKSIDQNFNQDWVKSKRSTEELGEVLANRFKTIVKPIKDKYDYLDEVFGVIAFSIIGPIVSFGLLVNSVLELGISLAIKINPNLDDQKSHLEKAAISFALSIGVLLASIAGFLKSLVSLISRPLVTLFAGWGSPGLFDNRFCALNDKGAGIIERTARTIL